ncbi:DNA internalization-related competence protein ComEC/Rec2 [Desulfonatronospira sp.]|uniref:DNA internalization-related competence protein ComEC/Rec2 n=1 Tax=Desulfonatronospira sp. TaxID=1962951 RepID=UPI0025C07863|nr:DNA internalization-related competence protein ComEC/Rec2 [Desulfonatronospira sp.]
MQHFQTLSPKGLLPWQKFLLAYILGIWTLKYPWAGLLGLLLVLVFFPFKDLQRNLILALVFLVAFLLAWFRLPQLPGDIPEPVAAQEKVWLQAEVHSVSYQPGDRQRIILKDLLIEPDREPVEMPGKLVFTWQEAPVKAIPGQKLQAHINIRPVRGMANFGVWNSEFYWQTQGVFWRSFARGEHFWHRLEGETGTSHVLRDGLKESALQGLYLQGLDQQTRLRVQAMGLALFFGDRSMLEQEVLEWVRLASLAHTLALSGLHLGIMAGMGFLLAAGIGYAFPRVYLVLPYMKLGIVLAAPICIVYLWMGQFQPTLIRAGIMLACWGWYLFANQRRVLLDGLFMAAALITLYNPWAVFDIRLQLSVMAVAGIALTMPFVERLFNSMKARGGSRVFRYVLGLAGVTLAANLALLPIQAWTFNYLSPHLYLNLIWLPVLGFLVLPAGFAGIFVSMIPGVSFIGDILLGLSGHLLGHFITLLQFMNDRDLLHPVITYRPSWAEIYAYYLVLGMLIYFRHIEWRKERVLLGVGIMLCLVAVPWTGQLQPERVTMRVLDVGQGQGVLLVLPGDRRILVDGGGSWNPDFDLGRAVVTPSLTWRNRPRSLDKVILSHAHVDHYGGLIYPMSYLGAGKYLHNGIWPEGSGLKRLQGAIQRQDISKRELFRGDALDLGHGVSLKVLHPQDPENYELLNDSSLVLLLVWHETPLALIPGDIEAAGLDDLLQTGKDLKAQVVMVPHHGSQSSAQPEFYSRVAPEIAVVSRGFMNRFRVPHQEVLDIIREQEIRMYDTAVHGEVVISWDRPGADPRIHWARSRTGPKGVPYWY